ncbi:MFS general substrate transporter [Neoconidiobolus thromboides FSU 785]|nr:MFS general substrate transporter [Neoconidiobolus thromboides FSU 785]
MNLEINRNEETETDYDETSQLYQNDQDFPLINEIEQEPKLISWFGLRVLLSCFLLQALSFGPISSFGIYQEYLSNEHPNINQHLSINLSLFSWVGTLCAALNSFFSLPSGILCDRFGHKLIAIIASFIMAISLLLASFSTQLWHLYLTQGVLCGIGISLANMPATSLPVLHFKHYGGLATGLTSAGAGIGGMSLSYLNGYLLNVTGYQNTLRINALILFFGLLISSLLIVPPKSNQAKDSYDFRTFNFKQVFDNIYENWSKYMLFSLVGLFHSFAYLIPFYFLGIFTSTELKMGWSTAAILISVLNLSSGLGKISIGLIGDKMNNININKKNIRLKYKLLNLYHLGKHPLPFNTYSFLFLVTLIASSVACFFWLLACIHPFNEPHFHNLDTIILSLLFTFVISYGILSGGSITCSSMVAKELFGIYRLF